MQHPACISRRTCALLVRFARPLVVPFPLLLALSCDKPTGATRLVGPGQELSLAQSTVTIPDSVLASGEQIMVTLHARDGAGAALVAGDLHVSFSLVGGTSTGTIGSVSDHGDGSYTASIVGATAGTPTSVHAAINSAAVTSPPPVLRVAPGRDSRKAASITITPPGQTSAGGMVRFEGTARDANGAVIPGKQFTWTVLTPAVASINEHNGEVTPRVTFGQTTVAASADGVTSYAVLTAALPGGAQVTTWTHNAPVFLGATFNSEWGSSPSDVYAVGRGGYPDGTKLFHWDGTQWGQVWQEHFFMGSIWGASASDVFVGGEEGLIWHFDGTAWTQMHLGDDIRSLWGSSPNDVYAATTAGLIHYDGQHWTANGTGIGPNGPHPTQIWGLSASDIYAVVNSQPYHFDGSQWAAMTGGTNLGCTHVWATSPSNVYCMAESEVWRFDGSSWTALHPPPAPPGSGFSTPHLTDIWGSSASDIYVVGYFNELFGYDGTAWHIYSQQYGDNPDALWALWGMGGDIFANGQNGLGFHGAR